MEKKQTLKDREYILVGSSTPISYSILSKDTPRKRLLYFDEEKQQQRALRYARNQKTPFMDDQDGNAIIEPIVFEDGILRVAKTNPVLQHFLSLHPGNTTNGGNEFYEFDPEREAAENVENLNIEVDALIAARTLDLNKMLAIGRVYLTGNVDVMSTSELKRDILLYAKSNPYEFLEAIDNPELGLANIASRAQSEGYIIIRGGKDIYYNLADNKKKLLTVPYGENPLDVFSSWLHSEQGKDFYEYLRNVFEDK